MLVKHQAGKGAIEVKNLLAIKNKVLKVGWFENSRYEDGTPVAAIAAQNEYGNPSKKIPARPFMRPTISHQQKAWRKTTEKGATAILEGKLTEIQALDLLGKQVVFDIQKTISALQTPPLALATIRNRLAKKRDKKTIGLLTKPLIDTGLMFGTIYSVIEDA